MLHTDARSHGALGGGTGFGILGLSDSKSSPPHKICFSEDIRNSPSFCFCHVAEKCIKRRNASKDIQLTEVWG